MSERGRAVTNYTVTLTELEAQIKEVAQRRLGLSVAEVEAQIDSGEWEKDEDNYELWSWLRGMVGSARAMRGRRGKACPDIRRYTEAELRRKISRLARCELGISGREAIKAVRSQEIPMEKCHIWDIIDGWAFLLLDDPRRH